MALITVLFSAAVFLIVFLILREAGALRDKKKRRLSEAKGTLEEGEQYTSRFRKEILSAVKKEKKEKQKLKGPEKVSRRNRKLQEELITADMDMTVSQYTRIRLIFAVCLLAGSIIFCRMFSMGTAYTVMLTATAGCAAIIIPHRAVLSRMKKRQDEIRRDLPDVMDLMVVSVEAGLGFDNALVRLAEKKRSPVTEELMKAQSDIRHGVPKKEAYEAMMKRCNVREMSSFVSSLLQAEQLGISVKSVLRTQSEALRKARQQRAEEAALKAPVKMMLPMVIFIFPIIFVILLAPAVINMMDLLGT